MAVSFFVSCVSPKWEMPFLTGHFALVGKQLETAVVSSI